jgi:hypothetical protein
MMMELYLCHFISSILLTSFLSEDRAKNLPSFVLMAIFQENAINMPAVGQFFYGLFYHNLSQISISNDFP